MWKRTLMLFASLFVSGHARAQDNHVDVPLCDLSAHPKAFDQRTIRVRATLSVYFEDFSLSVKNCSVQQGIWLAFGGDVPGIVVSMVNDNFRKPGTNLQVNGTSYGMVKDENFRRLYALIAAVHGSKPAYRVTATLTGTFLAGEESRVANGKSFLGGYGHLGCCSLLVITRVSNVVSFPPADLNVAGTVFRPDGKPFPGFLVLDDVLGGSPPQRQTATADSKGNFRFSDSGQLLRFEDPNYRPLALPVETGNPSVRVKLEDTKNSDWVLEPCRQNDSANRIGFSVWFTMPSSMESEAFDAEGTRSFFVFPHGSSAPEAEFIVSSSADQAQESTAAVASVWSEERWIKNDSGKVVGIDARGRRRRGERWRTATFFGHDAAGYNLRLSKPTTDLDAILNSACTTRD
jgi:hypothetical protein